MKRVWPLLLGAVCLAFAQGVAAQGSATDKACANKLRDVGLPKYRGDDPPKHNIICNSAYVLSHNSETKMPDWVVEELTPERFVGPGDRNDSSFKVDPAVTALGVPHSEDADYAGTGFDRGHMAPAADMKPTQEMMDESHFLSNISPQVGIGFNRHIWAELEDEVRQWTLQRGKLIVITGPIYDDDDRVMKNTDIPVPPRFYKIIYEPGRKRSTSFILPNKKIKGRDLEPFLASIDDIEEATGLDFFPDLDKRVQRRIERNVPELWNH